MIGFFLQIFLCCWMEISKRKRKLMQHTDMDHSSDEDSEISDSEIDAYAEKKHKSLNSKEIKIRNSENYRCPFCVNKKRKIYGYKDLLQHASAMGASPNQSAKEKANHRAVAEFLKGHPPKSSSCTELMVMEPEPHKREEDQFVYPWTGIIANLPTESAKLREELSRFNPSKVIPFRDRRHRQNAVVNFSKDWNGFKDAMSFEKHFELKHGGKKDWLKENDRPLCGWVARADDYGQSCGMIGDYLQKKCDLKTISQVTNEEARKTCALLTSLTKEIDQKSKNLEDIECKYNESCLSLKRAKEELQHHDNEMRRMQCLGRDQSQKMLELKEQLDSARQELEFQRNQFGGYVAQNDKEKLELVAEKEEMALINNNLKKALLEQKMANKDILKICEEQKKEKEAALNKIIDFEKQQLIGKHEDELMKIKGKLTEELMEKIEDMEVLDDLNKTLIIKERTANDELQETRKSLINGLSDVLNNRTSIGIKRMGEIDKKAFQIVCREKFKKDEAELKAALYCTKWQDQLRDPNWHPFKIIVVGDDNKEVLMEDDKKLVALKRELGSEVYNAVIRALREMNAYNPSGRYTTEELWNFKEDKRATLMEVCDYIINLLKVRRKKR